MKFLCDNCKAKYQIADEKVAGKTVRMKCRKCGHQIEVRAAVTETSVSTSPPKYGGAPNAPQAGGAKGGLATSLSAAKPRAPVGQQPAGGALAGAFQRTVQDGTQTAPLATPGQNNPVELSVTDEWYVAINGVPVGPVRISELRRKAASGAVNEESLCWQEGLEEWRPVRSIPDLAAIVREAALGNRPSLIAPPPNERISSPPRPPQRSAPGIAPSSPVRGTPEPARTSSASYGPPRPAQQPQRSNVVPLRVAASSADEAPNTAPLGAVGTALAPAFNPQLVPPSPAQPISAPRAVADPFALPPQESTAGGTAMMAPAMGAYRPSLSVVPPAPRRGVPLWFWPILLFTGVFGAAAAIFIFRPQPQAAPVVIQLPGTSAPSATEAKNAVPVPAASGTEVAPPITSAAPTKTGGGTGTKGTAVAAAAATSAKPTGIDLGGLGPIAGGPNAGPGAAGPGAGGGGLDSSSVQRVVASHQNGVKRTCWERGGGDSKSSVNVVISAQVGPAGNVVGTSSSGDDPVVAKCIEAQVKTWQFNAPGAQTTVNIPFKFVRQ